MSDRPPVVNFKTASTPLSHLDLQRKRLKYLIEDVEHSIKEVRRFESEGERYASYAVAWAATMTLTDILKISLSALDRRAKLLFEAQDKSLAQASKILQLLGYKPLATKADLLKTMDSSLELAPKLTDGIRKAQKALKGAKVKVPKHFTLLLDLGTTLCDDFFLMIDAGMTSQHVQNQSAQSQEMMRKTLAKLRKNLLLTEQAYTQLFEEGQVLARTA